MYTTRRTNEIGGSGWGVHVSWKNDRDRCFDLFVRSVQRKLLFPPHVICLRNANTHEPVRYIWWDKYPLWLDVSPTGRLKSIGTYLKSEHDFRNILDGPDMLPFYGMAQNVRKRGDGGFILLDWLLDLELPEIEQCLNYGSTPTGSPLKVER